MRFLNTLQKARNEQPVGREANEAADSGEHNAEDTLPIELLLDPAVKFGAPEHAVDGTVEVGAATNGRSALDLNVSRPVPEVEIEPKSATHSREIEVDSGRVNPRLVSITQPQSTYCEEYRNLRTHVLHKSRRQKLQSIVVASVGPSEGKSITALNVSWLLAQTEGLTSLVIDSDLRRPSLATYLGVETEFGLSDLLDETISLSEAIVKLEPAGLHLLAGGAARSDVAEQISGQKFKDILNVARAMFDYVIIDAPPLAVFTDATVLINHADAALLVIRANQTPYKDVDRVLEMLPRDRILGVVLNQSEDTLVDKGYYEHQYYSHY